MFAVSKIAENQVKYITTLPRNSSLSFLKGPVDHCDAKGCSHKCAYQNYDVEDYVCTCPSAYISTCPIGPDGKTCQERTEPAEPVEPGKEPAIQVSLIATDCLWSQWGSWTKCSGTCGPAFRTRTRRVLIPARNGGRCRGGTVEKWQCNLVPCKSETTTQTITESTTEDQTTTALPETQTTTDEPVMQTRDQPRGLEIEKVTVSLPDSTTEKPETTTTILDMIQTSTAAVIDSITTLAFGDKIPDTTVAPEEAGEDTTKPSVETISTTLLEGLLEETSTSIPETEQKETTVESVEATTISVVDEELDETSTTGPDYIATTTATIEEVSTEESVTSKTDGTTFTTETSTSIITEDQTTDSQVEITTPLPAVDEAVPALPVTTAKASDATTTLSPDIEAGTTSVPQDTAQTTLSETELDTTTKAAIARDQEVDTEAAVVPLNRSQLKRLTKRNPQQLYPRTKLLARFQMMRLRCHQNLKSHQPASHKKLNKQQCQRLNLSQLNQL